MVLAELERLLAPAGFKLLARRLESTLGPGLERLSLPRAHVFVTDAHAPHQTTEVLVAGIQERYPRARQVVVAEEFREASAFRCFGWEPRGYSAIQKLARDWRKPCKRWPPEVFGSRGICFPGSLIPIWG